MAGIIAAVNQKGGTGKSATAINLAAFLGQKRKTLLVDMDPQGHCAESFALDGRLLEPTIAELLMEWPESENRRQWSVRDAIRPVRNELSLIPANRVLAMAEIEIQTKVGREWYLHQVLSEISSEYEFIIVDCPPHMGVLVSNALVAADTLIVPISTITAYQSTTDLFEILDALQRLFGKTWNLKVLQTFYRANVGECENLRQALAERFQHLLLDTRINLNTDISKAMGAGRPITDYPQSSGYLDYKRLTEEVLRATEAQRDAGSEIGTGGGRARRRPRRDDAG